MLHLLARDEVLPRDHQLLALGVAGEVHHFHPVQQRTRDILEEIRGADEQHLAQVERHAEVMIDEAVVLGRIEHFQQGAGRVALEGDAQLVHLIEEEDRVLGAGLFHRVQDAARHRPHVGAPVTADIGFIARTTERNADVLPSHRAGNRLGHRGLADTGRPDEEEDRALAGFFVAVALCGGRAVRRLDGRIVISTSHRRRWRGRSIGLTVRLTIRPSDHRTVFPPPGHLFLELTDGEEFEHPVLYVAEGVVILIEDGAGLDEIQ